MDARKIKLYLLTGTILTVFAGLVFFLFIGGDMMSLKDFTQTRVHGVITNHTTHPIRITEFRFVRVLPPGMSSQQIGVNDADSLIIDHPTQIDGERYETGVFKFCDLAQVSVVEQGSLDVFRLNPIGNACKWIGDYEAFPSIPQAFPIRKPRF